MNSSFRSHMSSEPLHSRSTFWYILISIFIGLAVLFLDRQLGSLSFHPKLWNLEATSHDELVHTLQSWVSSIRLGDHEAYRTHYANRLTRFYNRSDVPVDEVVQVMADEVRKYSIRDVNVSNLSFHAIGKDDIELNFDKTYRFSGPGVRPNAGGVRSTLRFTRAEEGVWQITAEFDREICWSTLMRDPYLQSPPGRCP